MPDDQGSNGQRVTNALLSRDIAALQQSLDKFINKLEAWQRDIEYRVRVLELSDARASEAREAEKTKPIKQPPDDDEIVKWDWVRDKLAVPVITAFVIWFLIDILPNIITYLPKP